MAHLKGKARRRVPAVLLAAAALIPACLFAGCGKAPDPEPAERPRVQVDFPDGEGSLPAPAEEKETDAPAIPEAAVLTRAGEIFWNGEEIPLYRRGEDGVRYAAAEKLASAAGAQLAEGGDGVSFSAGGESFFVSSLIGGFYRGKTRVGDPVTKDGALYLPAEPVIAGLDLARLDDGDSIYLTRIVKSADVPKGVRAPVLMYHAVSDDTWGIKELFVRPSEMEKQLKYLVDHGYTTVTFEDLDRIDSIKKPVFLTFDDGYRDNYEELFPLLKKYNCKATIFMISGKLGKKHYLTEEMIREMADSGLVSIQSHTVSHPKLAEITGEKLRAELRDSRIEIARLTKRIPFVLCYPSGSYNDETRRVGAEYYQFGIKMTGGGYNTSAKPFLIPRYYVSRAASVSSFASMIG